MADNTDEEHLDNPINNQSENPPEEITPTADTETITKNQETENMEVHHHAHHEGKKNWKSYLWEFLMLFLAVFCGFLAEYQLEQTIEKHRGKEIVISLLEDIKKDTALLNTQLTTLSIKKNILDSLVIVLSSPDIKEKGADQYYYGRKIIRFTFLRYTDRTIQQLKNAGSYRLIKNAIVSDSILKYYSSLDELIRIENQASERVEEYIVNCRQVFDPLVFEMMVNDETNNKITRPAGNPPLLTYDRKPILYLISIIHNLKSANRGITENTTTCYNEAKELIKFLKSEYHLD